MARIFCIPGIVLLSICLILSFLVSLSLPYLRPLEIVRVQVGNVLPPGASASTASLSEIRFGIWSYCYTQANNGDVTCSPGTLGYSINLLTIPTDGSQPETISLGSSWTNGLVLHPISTFFILFALLLSFSEHLTVTLLASLMSFVAAGFTLIAFAIDIALYVHVRNIFSTPPGVPDDTNAGAGFWMTFTVLLLLLISGCIVCFGRRKDKASSSRTKPLTTKKPWYNKFRR